MVFLQNDNIYLNNYTYALYSMYRYFSIILYSRAQYLLKDAANICFIVQGNYLKRILNGMKKG